MTTENETVPPTEKDCLITVESAVAQPIQPPSDHTNNNNNNNNSLLSTLRVYWPLGFICFGGAPAHIAILHHHLVVKHKIVDEELFLELLGLSQAVPGPTSSQLAAASAVTKYGFLGGLLVLFLFVLPGFLVLLLSGLFLTALVDPNNPPIFLLGIPPAAVALICKACYVLGAKLDRLGVALAIVTTALAVLIEGDEHLPITSSEVVYPLLLLMGGLVTWGHFLHTENNSRRTTNQNSNTSSSTKESDILGHEKIAIPLWTGITIFLSWFGILVVCTSLVHSGFKNVYLEIFEVCFRIGSIFFGGAVAVIPLLENEAVPRHWLTDQQFMQGLGLAQSMPGPNASLAAFVGAAYKGLAGGLVAEIGLLGPGFLLIFAVIPFWSHLRHTRWFQAILKGVNATAIGFICAACVVLFLKGVHTAADAMIFVLAAGLTIVYDVSAPLALLVGVVIGALMSRKVLDLGQLPLVR